MLWKADEQVQADSLATSFRARESEREGGGYAVPKFNHKTIVSTEMMKQDEIPWINIIT